MQTGCSFNASREEGVIEVVGVAEMVFEESDGFGGGFFDLTLRQPMSLCVGPGIE